MPKDRDDEKRKRRDRHHRCRSSSEENRILEARLKQMQKQLDEITRREERMQEPVDLAYEMDADSPDLDNNYNYDNLSCHLPFEGSLVTGNLEVDDANSQILSVQKDDHGHSPVPNNLTEHSDQEMETSGLQENILQILGFEPTQTETHGPPIHSAIKPRWMDILISGLNDDIKSEIIKKYVIPENLPDLKVPKLNPEVKVALSTQVLRRDERLVIKQAQLSGCISGLGRALTSLLSKEGDNHDIQLIEYLSDTGRLLCDYFCSETKIRKELILINLNKDLRDVLAEAPVNSFLFGDSLEDRLKTAKNLEKAGLELRQSRPPKIIKKPPTVSSSLNLKGPLRAVKMSRGGHVQVKAPYQQRPYHPYPRPTNVQRSFPQNSLLRRPNLNNLDQARLRGKVENIRQRR